MKRIAIFLMILLSIMLIGCKSTKSKNLSVVRESIEESNKQLDLAYQNGDINILLSLFTKDCILSPVGLKDVKGENELEDFLKKVFENHKVNSWALTVEELEVFNNTIFERGTFHWDSEYKNDTPIKGNGRYFAIRKCNDQNIWVIHRFIENALPSSDTN